MLFVDLGSIALLFLRQIISTIDDHLITTGPHYYFLKLFRFPTAPAEPVLGVELRSVHHGLEDVSHQKIPKLSLSAYLSATDSGRDALTFSAWIIRL